MKNRFFIPVMTFLILVMRSPISMAAVTDDIEAAIGDRLPALNDVLPGYKAPAGDEVSIAIGDFYSDSDDGVDWGYVLAEVMRTDLTGKVDMPSMHVRKMDAWTLGMDWQEQMRSDDSLALYYKRYGTRQYVSGRIHVAEESFIWNVYIRSLPDRNTLHEIKTVGNLSELPDALQKVLTAIVDSVDSGIKVSGKKYALRTLQAYGNLLTQIKDVEITVAHQRISDAMERHRGFVPMVILYANYYPVPYEYDEVAKQQRAFSRLAEEYKESAAAQYSLVRNMKPNTGRYSVADEKITLYKKYVSKFPHDSMGMINLVDGLVSNERQLQGLAVALEGLKRWPDNFRLWWDLNYALDSYSWRVRGSGYWNEVPPEGKRLFPVLKKLALEAANEAVSRNADNAKLWNQHMRAIGTYNDEFKNSFQHAIAIDPGYVQAYDTALNYAAPKWGGTVEQQYEIVALARSNNPNAMWPQQLAKKYIEDDCGSDFGELEKFLPPELTKLFSKCSTFNFKMYGVLILLVLLVLVFAFVSRSQRR